MGLWISDPCPALSNGRVPLSLGQLGPGERGTACPMASLHPYPPSPALQRPDAISLEGDLALPVTYAKSKLAECGRGPGMTVDRGPSTGQDWAPGQGRLPRAFPSPHRQRPGAYTSSWKGARPRPHLPVPVPQQMGWLLLWLQGQRAELGLLGGPHPRASEPMASPPFPSTSPFRTPGSPCGPQCAGLSLHSWSGLRAHTGQCGAAQCRRPGPGPPRPPGLGDASPAAAADCGRPDRGPRHWRPLDMPGLCWAPADSAPVPPRPDSGPLPTPLVPGSPAPVPTAGAALPCQDPSPA